MSKLGKLCADIHVEGGALQSHYGPDDPIRGQVVLSYEPVANILRRKTTPAELFGPLKIQLKVYGRAEVRIRHQGELSTNHNMDIFCQTISVFEGPFKAAGCHAYPFPFTFTFPEDFRAKSSAAWVPTPTTSVPPTFGMNFSARHDLVNIRIEYLVEVLVSVKGIKIKTILPQENLRPVINYTRPRPSGSLVNSSAFTFQERVEIFGSKPASPKALPSDVESILSSCPNAAQDRTSFKFDVICTHHRLIYAGQVLTYRIKVSHAGSASRTIFLPTATLKSLSVDLVATTSVDASERIIGSNECVDKRVLQKFAASTSSSAEFSAANDHTVDVVLDRITSAPCSFAHRKVTRSYLFRLDMKLKVADKIVSVARDCPVTMVPQPVDGGLTDLGSPASWLPPWSAVEDDMPPPTYNEARADGLPTRLDAVGPSKAGFCEQGQSKV